MPDRALKHLCCAIDILQSMVVYYLYRKLCATYQYLSPIRCSQRINPTENNYSILYLHQVMMLCHCEVYMAKVYCCQRYCTVLEFFQRNSKATFRSECLFPRPQERPAEVK